MTLFKITPAILISGSNALNPNTSAAALLTRLLEFIIKITGASRDLATDAVLPMSLIESIPSYRPLTPSIMAMSLPSMPLRKESLTCPLSIKKESKFLEVFPVAKV